MDYYRKPINKVVNDVKLKMQLGALTLKLSENNKKIDDLIGVDKNIKKDVSSNTSKVDNNKSDISTNSGQISTNTDNISSNLGKINTNKSDIDEINPNLSNIDFNSGNKFSIENFFIYNIEIEKNYILDKNKTSFFYIQIYFRR